MGPRGMGRLAHYTGEGVPPQRFHDGDAGYDLTISRDTEIPPLGLLDVPTGIRVALPDGIWGQIMARSSTFYRYGLQVMDAVIDNGYRGPLFVMVYNTKLLPVTIPQGARIAQLVPHEIVDIRFVHTDELPETGRNEGGFGSTGR